jgi:hypothetical protein
MIRRFVVDHLDFETQLSFTRGVRTGSKYCYKENGIWRDDILLTAAETVKNPALIVNDKETLLVFYEKHNDEKSYVYDLERCLLHKLEKYGFFHGFLNDNYLVYNDLFSSSTYVFIVTTTLSSFKIDTGFKLDLQKICKDIPILILDNRKTQVLYRFDPSYYPVAKAVAEFPKGTNESLKYLGSGLFHYFSEKGNYYLVDILNNTKKHGSNEWLKSLNPDYVENGVDTSFYGRNFPKSNDIFCKIYYYKAMMAISGLNEIRNNLYYGTNNNGQFEHIQVVYRHSIGQNIKVYIERHGYFYVDILNDGTMYDREKSNTLIGKITELSSIPQGQRECRTYKIILERDLDSSDQEFQSLTLITNTVRDTAKLDKALDLIPHLHVKFDYFQLIALHHSPFGLMLPKTTIHLIGHHLSRIKNVYNDTLNI